MPLTACCSCGGSLTDVLDLGPMYLADFTDPGESRGEPWPLRLLLCGNCTLLQVAEPTPRKLLLHDRYGFRSGINEANRADVHDIARHALGAVASPRSFLDIGSNDGTLLAAVPRHVRRVGIDPLGQFAAEAARHADAIITDYFSPARFSPGEFDVITSAAMFYELEDPAAFVTGVRDVLARDGAWVIQQNYALDMLRNNVVDNIVHEHVAYYSVRSLSHLLGRHGMEVSDVTYSPVKGGCMRTLVSHKGARPVNDSVAHALFTEAGFLIDQPETWQAWGKSVRAELEKTRHVLEQAKADGKRAWIYGASTRGGTMLQVIGAGPELTPFAVERDETKFGKVMASVNVPIISEAEMRADPPDMLLVSPWFFGQVFKERERAFIEAGGKLLFPLPRFEVYPA